MARVLVVDDEALIRSGAADMMDQLGHPVVEARNADEAIRILESRRDIDAVFSDVQMPGTMDGVQLMRVIRHRWPPILLILTSGRPLAKDAQLPKTAVFITKPYEISIVEKALADATALAKVS